MEITFWKLAKAYAYTKGAQAFLGLIDPLVKDDTYADLGRHIAENYVCKGGSAVLAACAIDRAVSKLEELVLPKSFRGFVPLACATVGTALAIHYGAQYTDLVPVAEAAEAATAAVNAIGAAAGNLVDTASNTGLYSEQASTDPAPGVTFGQTAAYLFYNCRQVFVDMMNLNSNYKEGYLISSLVAGISGIRWLINMGEAIAERANEKRLEEEIEKRERQGDLEASLNGMFKKKRGSISKMSA